MSIPLRITHRTTSHESPYMVKDINGTVVFYAKYEHEARAFVRGVQFASNQKGRKMAHIESMETHDTGGHCLVDILTLPSGKILAVSDEYAGLYESTDAMYENEPINGFWLNEKKKKDLTKLTLTDLQSLSREELLEILANHDRDGEYLDEQRNALGEKLLTREDAVKLVILHLNELGE